MTLALALAPADVPYLERLQRMYDRKPAPAIPADAAEFDSAHDTDPRTVYALTSLAQEMRALAERNPGERVPHTLSNNGQPSRLAFLDLRKDHDEWCLRIAWSGGVMPSVELHSISTEFGVPAGARITKTAQGEELQKVVFTWDELDQLTLF